MKKWIAGLVIALTVIGINLKAEAVLINYDGTGNNWPTNIGGYYSGLAGSPVHSPGFMWLDYGGSIDSTYGPHSTTAMAFAIDTNPVSINWSSGVDSVDFWYGYQVNTTLSVKGFNGSTEIFDSGVLSKNSGGMFHYTAPDSVITKLEFYGTPNYWTMDDLSYNTSDGGGQQPVVPEPATMSLLGTGLLAFVGSRRRKQ